MGIPRYPDSDGPTTRPAKRGDETEIEFRQRELAWQTSQSGVGSGAVGGLGIPAPWFGSVGVTGVRLGDFGVASTANLPPPTRAGVSDAFDPDSPVRYRIDDPNFGDSPSFPADGTSDSHASPGLPAPQVSTPIRLSPGRFGPVGGIAQGLREARDPTPEEIERAQVLAATGFDANWGTPPGGGSGLAWSADRYLYVPDRSKASGSYAFQARDGYYLQPYRDDFGTWRTRWIYAGVSTPDVARPYRVVDAQTAGGLSSQTGDPTIDRIKTGEFREDPNAVFVPKYGPPKRAIKLSDYAWVGQKQMPVGCPYPYPAMPVPIADYTSGRWLDADYAPSIPLPPPYDQTPWQCGVSRAPGKPHKGGAPPEVEPTDIYKQVSEPDTLNVVIDVDLNSAGIPAPTGSAAPVNPTSGPVAATLGDLLRSNQADEAAKKDVLATEKDPAKREALQREIDALRAKGVAIADQLQDALLAEARARGLDRYGASDSTTVGGKRPPPGLPADPPTPKPPPGPDEPPTPPPTRVGSNGRPCATLLVQVMVKEDANSGIGQANAAPGLGIAARKAVLERAGCTVRVITVDNIWELACWAYKAAKKGEKFLHVEIYGHGTSGGPNDRTPLPNFDPKFYGMTIDSWSAVGLALGSVMTNGESGQGHIVAGWCHSCQNSSGVQGKLVGGIVAGMSGHGVVGPRVDIVYPANAPGRGEKKLGEASFDEPYALPDGFNKLDPKSASYTGDSGWLVHEPTFTSELGVTWRNDGDRDPVKLNRKDPGGSVFPYSPFEIGGVGFEVTPGTAYGITIDRDTISDKLDPHRTALPGAGADGAYDSRRKGFELFGPPPESVYGHRAPMTASNDEKLRAKVKSDKDQISVNAGNRARALLEKLCK